MTHNQFSGRTLSKNLSPPASPNIETKRRRPLPGPPPTVIVHIIFSGIISGHQTTEPGRWLTPSRIASASWQSDWLSLESIPLRLAVSWDPTSPILAAQLQGDYGAGYVAIDSADSPAYLGREPFDSGPRPWAFHTGSLDLAVQGNWQP